MPVIGGVAEGGSVAEVGDLAPAVIDQHGLELGEVLRTHEDVGIGGVARDDDLLAVDDTAREQVGGHGGALDVQQVGTASVGQPLQDAVG